MRTTLTDLIKTHILKRRPSWRKLQSQGIAITNLDYFGDPRTFLQAALQNEYINKDTPEQIWYDAIALRNAAYERSPQGSVNP